MPSVFSQEYSGYDSTRGEEIRRTCRLDAEARRHSAAQTAENQTQPTKIHEDGASTVRLWRSFEKRQDKYMKQVRSTFMCLSCLFSNGRAGIASRHSRSWDQDHEEMQARRAQCPASWIFVASWSFVFLCGSDLVPLAAIIAQRQKADTTGALCNNGRDHDKRKRSLCS